jgi:hypothetical protein
MRTTARRRCWYVHQTYKRDTFMPYTRSRTLCPYADPEPRPITKTAEQDPEPRTQIVCFLLYVTQAFGFVRGEECAAHCDSRVSKLEGEGKAASAFETHNPPTAVLLHGIIKTSCSSGSSISYIDQTDGTVVALL